MSNSRLHFKFMVILMLGYLGTILMHTRQAQAATQLFVGPNGNASICSQSQPCSLTMATQTATPGTTVYLLPGTYSQDLIPKFSGSLNAPITFESYTPTNPAIINGKKVALEDKVYVTIKNLHFISSKGSWITSNTNTKHIIIEDSTFDTAAGTTTTTWGGIYVYGEDTIIRGNRFGDWPRGDSLYINQTAKGVLIENNDFAHARSEHGHISSNADYTIIRRNVFRNPWDRILGVTGTNDLPVSHVLIENNIFFEGDWNSKADPAGNSIPSDDGVKGAGGAVRTATSDSIIRNNLFLSNHLGPNASKPAESSALQFHVYSLSYTDESLFYENNRIYHNTFYQNDGSAIVFSKNTGLTEWHTTGNFFLNNVITNSGGQVAYFRDSGLGWETFHWQGNLVNSPDTWFLKDKNATFTVAQLQAQFPTQFIGNQTAAPTFFQANILTTLLQNPALLTPAYRDTVFQSFSLTTTSPGKQSAVPLTSLTSAASGTQLTVGDSRMIYDGGGYIPGDEVLVGTQKTTVQKRLSPTQLQVSPAITATSGTPIRLAAWGGTPDIGINTTTVTTVTPSPIASPTPMPNDCSVDSNGDHQIDLTDLIAILNTWQGSTSLTKLIDLLSRWNQPC